MQPGVCSLRDGALVTGSDWLWVLERRDIGGGEGMKKKGDTMLDEVPFDFQAEVCELCGT